MIHLYLQVETWFLECLGKVEGFFREKVRQESCWRLAFGICRCADHPCILVTSIPFLLAGTLSPDGAAEYCFDRSLPEGSEGRERHDDKDSATGATANTFPLFFYSVASLGFSLVCFWAWLFQSPQRAAKNSEAVILDIACKCTLLQNASPKLPLLLFAPFAQ
jgi:hypothetical protein